MTLSEQNWKQRYFVKKRSDEKYKVMKMMLCVSAAGDSEYGQPMAVRQIQVRGQPKRRMKK